MGTRIGFEIRSNNDDIKYPPAILLFSHSHTIDTEIRMRKLGAESNGPTELMMKISANNIETVANHDKFIFWVDASHEDTERVWLISFDYTTDGKVTFNMTEKTT